LGELGCFFTDALNTWEIPELLTLMNSDFIGKTKNMAVDSSKQEQQASLKGF